jgi:hypothetical protein
MIRTNDMVMDSCSVIDMYMTLYNIWVYCKRLTTAQKVESKWKSETRHDTLCGPIYGGSNLPGP